MTDQNEQMTQIERDLTQSREDLKESVSALGEKLTFGQMIDEVIEKSGFDLGTAKSAVGDAAKLTIPGAVLGAGVALLVANLGALGKAAGRKSVEGGYDFTRDWSAHERYRSAMALETEHAKRPGEDDAAHRSRVRPMQASALGYAREAGEDDAGFHDRIERGLHEAREAATAAGERLSHAAKTTLEAGKRMAHDAADGVKHTASGVKHGIGDATAAAGDKMRAGADRAQALYADHPAAGVALGLFVGALLGSVAPLSRKEKELLNKPAAKAAAFVAEAGERVAQDMGRAVRAAGADYRAAPT